MQEIDVPDKDFKTTVINMLKELKENMSKEIINIRKKIYKPNLNKENL